MRTIWNVFWKSERETLTVRLRSGDGIVLYESASRLPGDPELEGRKRTGDPANDRWHAHLRGVVETNHGHVGMLGDLDAVRKCFELLYGPAAPRH